MAVKVFGVAPAVGGEELYPGLAPIPFALQGGEHTYTAYPPKRASWKRSQLSQRKAVPLHRKIEVLVDFLNGCLRKPEDADELSDRLLDGTDPLDYVHLLPVVTWLMASWSEQMRQLQAGQPPTAGLPDPDEPEPEQAEAQPAVQVEASAPAQPQPPVQVPVTDPAAPTAAPAELVAPAGGLPPVPAPAAG